MTITTSPGPSFVPSPSEPSRQAGGWQIRGVGWERRGFIYEGTASNAQATEQLSFSVRFDGRQLALEIDSHRPAAFQFVQHLTTALGMPTTGPEILSIGELSDSDGEVPTYTVWTFRPGDVPAVREILARVFPR